MGRSPTAAARVGVAGVVALIAGSMMIVGVAVQALTAPAFADTSAFELFCTHTPIGDLVFNDVVLSGSLTPASPAPGQQFSLTNFQATLVVPADIVAAATAVGNTSITGTASATIAATGATPATMATGSLAYGATIPSPVPSSGMPLAVPSTPAAIGPFTATGSYVALSLGSAITLTFSDIAIPGGLPPLECSAYPNNVLPTGFAQGMPPGLPLSPVIASAGSTPPTTTSAAGAVTGPYELYCPHTPVGDLVFNDVTTSATVSPGSLTAGDHFQVTGYQTDIPVPAGDVAAAAGLGNSSFDGLAASAVDVYGATPPQLPTGSMGFDLPIPNPVPSSGLALNLPASPMSVGPFTASGGPITIAQDQSMLVVAKLSSKAFKMECTAFPNDSIATSGSTGIAPTSTPIRPIIATASASGTPLPTTTTTFGPGGPGPGNQTPGAPYELFCPSTPVGNIALNDVVTTASITPAALNEGDRFQLTNLQTQFTIPQGIAQQAENLGLTTLSGDLSMFLEVSGTGYPGFPGPIVGAVNPGGPVVTTSPGAGASPTTTVIGVPGPYPGPYPFPFPGENDMSFNVTLPSPVPSTGVQFTATPPVGFPSQTFIAAGGPIQVFASGANLNVSAFGDRFGLFCDTLVNDSVPTGLSIQEPFNGFTQPLIATGSATSIPPPPPPPGPPGSYELYCPGTPVGNIALNNVDTTGTITPSDPAPGQQFNLTGYQTTLAIPASIAGAAEALGNSALTGTATGAVDASGATPAQISTGTMTLDAPLPSPIPPGGITLTLPAPPGTIGPFTASGGAITLAEDGSVQLVLIVSGSNLTLRCSAYPNNTEPTGIVSTFPVASPISPTITTAGVAPVPTTTPAGPGIPTTTQPLSPAASTTTLYPATSTSVAGADPTTTAEPVHPGPGTTLDPPGPASTVSPVVRASSGALAFTGPGAATGWIVLAGGALIVLGLAMLLLADVPRRLRWAVVGAGRSRRLGAGEPLWVDAPRSSPPEVSPGAPIER